MPDLIWYEKTTKNDKFTKQEKKLLKIRISINKNQLIFKLMKSNDINWDTSFISQKYNVFQ